MQTQSRIIDEVVRRFKNRMTATGHIAFLATLALPYVCCALISDPRFKIEVHHLIKQTNLQKKAMKTYSC